MTRSTTATRSFTALLVAVGFAASLAASQYPAQKPAEKKMGSPETKTVSLTGCVREGDTPNSYVLANADVSSIPALSAPAGTAGTTPGAPATATLALISSKVDLKTHLGHKVEVSGTLAPPIARPSGTTGTPPEGTPAAEKEKKEKINKINVEAVKHISDTCTM